MESRLALAFEAAVKERKVPAVAAIALDKTGKILFKGAYGTLNVDDASAPAYTANTPTIIWSCTKLVTSVAALQLVEQGKIKLDDAVEKYVPSFADIKVLESFSPEGEPVYRAPKTKATILNLMTHTAGFTYDFFHELTLKWRAYEKQTPSTYLGEGKMSCFTSPLAFDPGAAYEYGVNIDWLGFVIEAVSGMGLNEYIEKNILHPLGLRATGDHYPSGQQHLIIHIRGADGTLTPVPTIVCADKPDRYGGGHYLCSTLDDYSNFLLTILAGGTHPKTGVQILKEETVDNLLFTDHIPKICSPDAIGEIRSCNPVLSNEGTFLPGLKKGWSCGLMLNPAGSLKGRSAGSGAWAGLGNLYYWLDPHEGKMGLIMAGILPFLDPEVCHLFDELERAVYGHESAKEVGEVGGNYKISKM